MGLALPFREQDPKREVAEVCVRNGLQAADEPFRVIYVVSRLGRLNDYGWIVVGEMSFSLQLYETTREGLDRLGVRGDDPWIDAPALDAPVL